MTYGPPRGDVEIRAREDRWPRIDRAASKKKKATELRQAQGRNAWPGPPFSFICGKGKKGTKKICLGPD